jgi:FtsP/CotA-like multicopper oxidase with cupredoxin domain
MANSTLPQLEFSCGQPAEGSPETPNRLAPDRVFERHFFNQKKLMVDGSEVEIWGFEDETGVRDIPSPLTRATEGEVVHVNLVPGKKVHTIHHHGIEPEPVNDGVGHTSFEVTGGYTYQWRPAQAGTFFYHCHVNTTLHVQMGMYGPLVIDPPEDPTLPPGAKRAFRDGPVYEVERIWAGGAIDPRWHNLAHAHGLCEPLQPGAVGLHDFKPQYIFLNGHGQPFESGAMIDSPDIAITAKSGQPILIRYINGTYVPQVIMFHANADGATLSPILIASDGHPFRDRSGNFRPLPITKQTKGARAGLPAFICSSAERYDTLLNTAENPAAPGVYPVDVEFRWWRHNHALITDPPINAPVAVAKTTITIEP